MSDPSLSKNMECVHEQLSTIIDHCTPYRECRVNHRQIRKEPWLTASINISIDRNEKLYSKMLKGECTKHKYKDYNNVLCKTIGYTKVQFYLNMCYEYKTQTKNSGRLSMRLLVNTPTRVALLSILKLIILRSMVPKRLVTDLLSTLQESVSVLPKEFPNHQKVSLLI